MSESEEKKYLSVKDLNMRDTPRLPLRHPGPLVCAVLSKSPLKDVNKGKSKMFTMTVADQDAKSNMRAVCFDTKLYEAIKPGKTYQISSFNLKKGYGNKSSYKEISLDQASHVEDAREQFTVKQLQYDITSILRVFNVDGSSLPIVSVKGKITLIEEPAMVGVPPDTKMRREVILTDGTGSLTMLFWRDNALSLPFSEGDVVTVDNLRLSNWSGSINGNVGNETSFKILQEQMEVAQDVSTTTTRKSNIVSLINCVEAIKDFSLIVKCKNCSKTQVITGSKKIISCEVCKTTFLASSARRGARCMVLLTEPKRQWYSAFTQVIMHLFNWTELKELPSEEDMEYILTSKYSLRIDIHRKVLEYAVQCNSDSGYNMDTVVDGSGTCKKKKVD